MTLTHRLFAQNVRDMRAMTSFEVEAAAGALLSRLLDHTARHVPFYRSLASVLQHAADDPEAWVSVPILTEGDRRLAGDTLLASELPPQDFALDGQSWTTLSTPIDGPYGLLTDVADKAQWEYLARRYEIGTAGRLAAILPSNALRPDDLAEPFGPWSLDAPYGRAHRWSEEFGPQATLTWLGHVRPDVLFIGPDALDQLLQVAKPGPPRLKEILLTGPALRADSRQACDAIFGARLTEAVTSTAGGFVAGREPDGLFVPALETALVEIVDDAGRPSPAGEPGRLVATALYGYRRAVIRHDLGLRAAWSDETLDCGRRRFRILPGA